LTTIEQAYYHQENLMDKDNRMNELKLNVLLAFISFILACSAAAWRIDSAPDVSLDEIIYTRVGINVATLGSFASDTGETFFVHPTLYFAILGAYLRLSHVPAIADLGPEEIFRWVHHARYLNAFFAGMTAVVMYLLGRRLRDKWLGIFLVIVFALDPFALCNNRRGMLETMAGMVSLLAMYLVLRSMSKRNDHHQVLRPQTAVLIGFIIGGSLLVKELTFTLLIAILLFAVLAVRNRYDTSGYRLLPFVSVIVPVSFYLIFPLWAMTIGQFRDFIEVKWITLRRLLGIMNDMGWDTPGISFFDHLKYRSIYYFSSYLIILLGGIATLFLLMTWRHQKPVGKQLAVWGLVQYSFYIFLAISGAAHPQFFYFLLVPSMIFIGYASSMYPEISPKLELSRSVFPFTVLSTFFSKAKTGITVPMLLVLIIILPFNAYRWVVDYGTGTDNAFPRLVAYINENVPEDEPLNTTGFHLYYNYLFPERIITDTATPEEAMELGVRYFIYAPKDVWANYGHATQDLIKWLNEKGELLFAAQGFTHDKIYLYKINYELPSSHSLPEHHKSVHKLAAPISSVSGSVNSLVLFIAIWLAIIVAWTVWLVSRKHYFSFYSPGARSHGSASKM
jgi:hypothetical protein